MYEAPQKGDVLAKWKLQKLRYGAAWHMNSGWVRLFESPRACLSAVKVFQTCLAMNCSGFTRDPRAVYDHLIQ